MEIKHARVVKKHLTAAGDHLFDDFVDGVIEGRGPASGVREETSTFRVKVRWILEAVSTSNV